MAQCRSPFALSAIIWSGLYVDPIWGLIRFGLVCFSLDGLVWLVGFGLFGLLGLVWMVWFGLVWFGRSLRGVNTRAPCGANNKTNHIKSNMALTGKKE